MAKTAPPPNDGGIVVVLTLLVAALAYGMITAVSTYAKQATDRYTAAANEGGARRLSRLLSGWANISNAIVHVILVIAITNDREKYLAAGMDDAEDLTGATVLAVLNTLVGLNSLRKSGKMTAFVWNMFIITAGTLLPPVWAKFFSVGLATWPYIAVFLWLGIFAFESTGFFASITWFALGDKEAKA